MKIVPMNDNILVGEDKKGETTTDFGLILSTDIDRTKTFTVIAVGEKVEHVTEGDRVILNLNGALPVEIGGAQRLVVPEKNVLARVEK